MSNMFVAQQPTQPYGYDTAARQWGNGNYNGPGGSFQLASAGASAAAAAKTASGTNYGSAVTPAAVAQNILQYGTGAIPDTLKPLTQQTTNTMTSTTGVSAPVQQGADQTANYISNLVGQGAGAATAGQGGQAQQFIQQMLSGHGPTSTASAAMNNALKPTDTSFLQPGAAPTTAATLANTDLSKYMNPALGAEEAAILHGGDVQNNAIRARQAMSGAFGGNSDVAQAEQNENIQRQLGLASSDAFKNASANAMSDVGALNQNQQQNRQAVQQVGQEQLGAQLTDAQRALSGGQAINSQAAATGGQAWQQYLQQLGYGTSLGSTAAGALGALPGTKTLAQSQLGPSAAGQELGALIGLTGLGQSGQPQGGGGISFSQQGFPGNNGIPGAT